MKLLVRILWLTLLCMPFVTSASLAKVPSQQEAREELESSVQEISALVKAADDVETLRTEIAPILSAIIDFSAFSSRTLKGHWGELEERERERFEAAFRALVMAIYAKRFVPGMVFISRVRGTSQAKEGDPLLIKTTLQGPKASVDVDYAFMMRGDGAKRSWRIIDISIDGVSMAQNWRSAFVRIMKRDGFDALITKIERKSRVR